MVFIALGCREPTRPFTEEQEIKDNAPPDASAQLLYALTFVRCRSACEQQVSTQDATVVTRPS